MKRDMERTDHSFGRSEPSRRCFREIRETEEGECGDKHCKASFDTAGFVNTNISVKERNSPSMKKSQRQAATPKTLSVAPSMPEAINEPVALAIKLPELR